MPFQYKIHKEALKEYADSYVWYENEQKGLGERLIDSIDKKIEQICDHPQYYSLVYGSYRQTTIESFPFTIVYQIFPERNLVHISSIFHNSRNPRKKFRKDQ